MEFKDYLQNLTLSEAGTLCKPKYSMTGIVKMDYKRDPGYEKSLWKCGKSEPGYRNLSSLMFRVQRFEAGIGSGFRQGFMFILAETNQLRCKEK